MTRLANARHERFAQALAAGKSADEAYQAAGYRENRGNSIRLKTNESVAARVAELQGSAAEKMIVTIETIKAMFIEDRIAAGKEGHIVTEKIAKLCGIPLEFVRPPVTTQSGNVIEADFSTTRKGYGGQ